MAEEGGLLSQEEVDALTRGLAGSGDGGAAFDGQSIRPAVDTLLEQARLVLSSNLGKDVRLESERFAAADGRVLEERFGKDGLQLRAAFEKGFSGELAFLLRKDTAAALGSLMLGAKAEAYSDDHKDAVIELGNQILGSACTELGRKFDTSASATQCALDPFRPGTPPFEPAGSAQIDLRLLIDGKEAGRLDLLLSQPLVVSLADPTARSPSGQVIEDNGFPAAFPEADLDQGSWMGSAVADDGAKGPPKIRMLMDISLNVTIELGRTNLSIRRILELGPGSIVEMDRLAGEPVDLLVNDKVVAKGEVVVVDEYFGIRIISLISPEERIRQLQ